MAIGVGAGVKMVPAVSAVHQLPVVAAGAPHPAQVHVGDARPGEQGLGTGEVVVAVPPPAGKAHIGSDDPAGLVGGANVFDMFIHIVKDGLGLVPLAHAGAGDLCQDLVGQPVNVRLGDLVQRDAAAGRRGRGIVLLRLLDILVHGDCLNHRQRNGLFHPIPRRVLGGVDHRIFSRRGKVHCGSVHHKRHLAVHIVQGGDALPIVDRLAHGHRHVGQPQQLGRGDIRWRLCAPVRRALTAGLGQRAAGHEPGHQSQADCGCGPALFLPSPGKPGGPSPG